MSILNNPSIPRINLVWSWCIILFLYYWIQFVNILLMIFLWSWGAMSWFPFLVISLLLNQDNDSLIKWVQAFSFFMPVLCWMSFGSIWFLRNWYIPSKLLRLHVQICSYHSLIIFSMCVESSNIHSFSLDIGNLCLLSFFCQSW